MFGLDSLVSPALACHDFRTPYSFAILAPTREEEGAGKKQTRPEIEIETAQVGCTGRCEFKSPCCLPLNPSSSRSLCGTCCAPTSPTPSILRQTTTPGQMFNNAMRHGGRHLGRPCSKCLSSVGPRYATATATETRVVRILDLSCKYPPLSDAPLRRLTEMLSTSSMREHCRGQQVRVDASAATD